VVRGHVAVVDRWGTVIGARGDPDTVTTLRSCVKPLQALPFVDHAADQLGVSDAELAVACASHSGEPVHVETVRRLLGRADLDEQALSCGPQLPYDDESAKAILAAGAEPGRIHNNCSGKHAAMLAVVTVRGWPCDGYGAFEHPLQDEIRQVMGRFGEVNLDAAPFGIDGCGLPTHGVSLRVLARMFAAASSDPGFRRCQDAMAAHPHLVGGRGRFDTALLAAAGQEITCKVGGAAVWVALRRPDGPALAIKLEAGEAAALPAVALAALDALGWLSPATARSPGLAGFRRPALRNWEGALVGRISCEPGWADRLTG
jgi:L-asparaginase II